MSEDFAGLPPDTAQDMMSPPKKVEAEKPKQPARAEESHDQRGEKMLRESAEREAKRHKDPGLAERIERGLQETLATSGRRSEDSNFTRGWALSTFAAALIALPFQLLAALFGKLKGGEDAGPGVSQAKQDQNAPGVSQAKRKKSAKSEGPGVSQGKKHGAAAKTVRAAYHGVKHVKEKVLPAAQKTMRAAAKVSTFSAKYAGKAKEFVQQQRNNHENKQQPPAISNNNGPKHRAS